MMSFPQFLREICEIPAERVPQYENWVALYLERRKTSVSMQAGQFPGPFLESLGPKVEKWQLAQARRAVQLYWYFKQRTTDGLGIEKPLTPPPGANRLPAPAPALSASDNAILKELQRVIRLHHLSFRTEKTYRSWAVRFLLFARNRKGSPPTQDHLQYFLSHLAVEKKVSASTQKVAFNSLLYLFRNVTNVQVRGLESVVRARSGKHLPVVLTVEEVRQTLAQIEGTDRLMASIIYGAGLRLEECLSLRIKDVDFARSCLTIRRGKGNKDRETVLPEKLVSTLRAHLENVRVLHESDREKDIAGVALPDALGQKFTTAGKQWSWFWVFPSQKLSIDPRSGEVRRYHVYPTTFQNAFKLAVARAGIVKHATVHTLRHYSALRTIAK